MTLTRYQNDANSSDLVFKAIAYIGALSRPGLVLIIRCGTALYRDIVCPNDLALFQVKQSWGTECPILFRATPVVDWARTYARCEAWLYSMVVHYYMIIFLRHMLALLCDSLTMSV